MMLVLLRRLFLRLTKVDMLASGADLVVCNAVSGSCGWLLGLPVVHSWSLVLDGLSRGAIGVLVILGVDASELLCPSWRGGMVMPSWLYS